MIMARLAAVRLSVFALLSLACGEGTRTGGDTTAVAPTPSANRDMTLNGQRSGLTLTSDAFTQGGAIPSRYTCDGTDASPPLKWAGAPNGTKSLGLIVDDPDAPDPAKPQRVYVHWVVYNLSGGSGSLPENATNSGLPPGAAQGKNDFGKMKYGGPCPPIGRHRYFFKLYALDTELRFVSPPTKADLAKAMKGHILAEAELMGTYQKK
jgi:Raf kinase inhibitor-like YbhB/YbcL family protein